jgi:hypothetical protein
MCPYCHTNAPLVYRGLTATCSACGRARVPLTGASLTHAGKPARLGGAVLGAFGWVALFFGLVFSTLLGLLVYAIFTATAGLVVGGIFALLSAGFFWGVRRGGQALEQTGEELRQRRAVEALTSLATAQGGVVTAAAAGRALDMALEEADALLTKLAKTKPDEVEVEVSDRGEVLYVFVRSRPVSPRASMSSARVRVAQPDARETASTSRDERDAIEAELEDEVEAEARRTTRR